MLEGVGGNPVPTLGHAEVEAGVGNARSFSRWGNTKSIACLSMPNSKATRAKIKLARYIEVPAQTERIVNCKATRVSRISTLPMLLRSL